MHDCETHSLEHEDDGIASRVSKELSLSEGVFVPTELDSPLATSEALLGDMCPNLDVRWICTAKMWTAPSSQAATVRGGRGM